MTITSKFKKDITTLRSAVNGDFFLDVKNPKLFKKVRKFYENDGVTFSGDPLDDYDILIDCRRRSGTSRGGVMKILLEKFPYRYVEKGELENGSPDYRIQKVDSYTGKYQDMYLLDNQMQLLTAMEDYDYTCWLDPAGVPCYRKDRVTSNK